MLRVILDFDSIERAFVHLDLSAFSQRGIDELSGRPACSYQSFRWVELLCVSNVRTGNASRSREKMGPVLVIVLILFHIIFVICSTFKVWKCCDFDGRKHPPLQIVNTPRSIK